MRRHFVLGGMIASVVLLVFGIASITMGVQGLNEVRASLAAENIVGTPDSEIPGELVDTGQKARIFAETIHTHALQITDGQTYAEMGRFLDAQGEPTNDQDLAATNESGAPVENPQRQVWVTATALSTALNMAYFGEQVALFSIIMGIALVLTGIGFGVLTLGALRNPEQRLIVRTEHEHVDNGRTTKAPLGV